MRIIFAGTPEFAVPPLQALIDSDQHQVVAVYTQPDRVSGRGKKLTPPVVKTVAMEHAIQVLQPESLADQQAIIQAFKPDLMVVVAYGMLLPQSILDIPEHGCINIHASLLPRWRGAAPIQRAIEAGDETTGVSIMRMEAGLDTGPVYQMLETPIHDQDTSADIHDRLAKLGAEGLIATLAQLPELQPIAQDHYDTSYAKKISKAEAVIDWRQSSSSIQQRIRAFIPWPICQTHHGKNKIRLWQSVDVSAYYEGQNMHEYNAGEIINLDSDGVDVVCGTGVLRLLQMQRDGGKSLSKTEFCNGYPLTVGDTFD